MLAVMGCAARPAPPPSRSGCAPRFGLSGKHREAITSAAASTSGTLICAPLQSSGRISGNIHTKQNLYGRIYRLSAKPAFYFPRVKGLITSHSPTTYSSAYPPILVLAQFTMSEKATCTVGASTERRILDYFPVRRLPER